MIPQKDTFGEGNCKIMIRTVKDVHFTIISKENYDFFNGVRQDTWIALQKDMNDVLMR